jgi:F0F1-type ATP synthase membrane subunit b/b'
MTDTRCRFGRWLLRAFGFVGWFVFLTAVPAFGQETGPSPADSTTGWIFRWLNFAIVFSGILYFALKTAGPYFRGRSEGIFQRVQEGARAREAAERQRREVQVKLSGIDQEVAELREVAKRARDAEAGRLRTLARQEAEAIERAARAEITAAERTARLELKALAARLAIERAEALLRQELGPEAQATLVHAFVEELGRSVN